MVPIGVRRKSGGRDSLSICFLSRTLDLERTATPAAMTDTWGNGTTMGRRGNVLPYILMEGRVRILEWRRGLPTSAVGLWLYAHATDDVALLRNIGDLGDDDGTFAVLDRAFVGIVRKLFKSPPEPGDYVRLVELIRSKYEPSDSISVADMERLVSSALSGTAGEQTSDIALRSLWFTQLFMFREGVSRLKMRRRDVASFLVQTERSVQQDGFLLKRALLDGTTYTP